MLDLLFDGFLRGLYLGASLGLPGAFQASQFFGLGRQFGIIE
jgi:hypothetical protein